MKKLACLRNALTALAMASAVMAPAIAEAGQSYYPGGGHRSGSALTLELQTQGGAVQIAGHGNRGSGYFGHGGQRRHGGYGRQACFPREAIEKAHWLGLRRPAIQQVTPRVIVVAGRGYRHWAQIVFARRSPDCRVIASRGI